ncbi:2-succinyl-5-enolpyruvyl-6-hydroxy-3-cyclohexene-1-carboxylate synthase [Flavobacterium croceum DSM 17960]|uniref:2-succinyl-5-enolpyruvyl-6-hydroxy-3-cyclohexene-1-carboxylate synthase n=2 Tax=Flavobacterium TaxID=237 RepID=A0A2S4N8K8_9FLAO|nr:2-succinyl-5-enolpyruvyl-6-hydroxy-3-cyclohexene-1-carboxylate synthase [Flavobacterium croceum DSM 17960]
MKEIYGLKSKNSFISVILQLILALKMIYPKIPLAQSVIEIFKAKGVQHIVISPGSRNAPLTIGFTSNQDFQTYSIPDERSAAFFALGMAQQLQKPVVVVCTSGSALLNYYPALAEAFYSQIPFIVVSADRPKDKIDIGDGQTIRQENVFENHSLYNANLAENASKDNDALICNAIDIAIDKCGPVHINVPFEEPLYQTVNELQVSVNITTLEKEPNEPIDFSEFLYTWNTARKKIVLIGGMYPNVVEKQYIEALGNDTSVLVLTEVTSNVHHNNFINHIDTLITTFSEEDFENFKPEILLTFGGMIVSKRIKAFFRKYKPKAHWHVDTLRAYDTFGVLSQHFKIDANQFLKIVYQNTPPNSSNYQHEFLKINASRKINAVQYLERIPFSDLKVFEVLLKHLPHTIQLHISNSSPIRYAQLFEIDSSIEVFCNRGTSGIDGCTSTAIGAAVTTSKPTVFITGDIGFFYDSNALWNNYIPHNFKLILINNRGGGIFRILPGHTENEVFNTYFETQHTLTAEYLAKMYGLDYFSAQNLEDLQQTLPYFFENNDAPKILEIITPTTINDEVLLHFFEAMR